MRLNPFARRRQAYQQLFGDPTVGHGRTVLADLRRFSRLPDAPIVKDGYGRVDPVASAVLAGRQEVVNRILAQLHISESELFNLKEDPDE